MRRAIGPRILAFAVCVLLPGCTPEGFNVAPCMMGGQLAFRIYPIDGWFRDYVPRPSSVVVSKVGGTRTWPGMWSAEATFNGDKRAFSRKLIVGNVLAYGQRLPGWDVTRPAKALSRGHKYSVLVADPKGHGGSAEFTAGEPLPLCS